MSTVRTGIELSVTIDGVLPYEQASRLMLSRVWVSENDILRDSHGNDVRPVQVQTEKLLTQVISDPDGLFAQPLVFYFEKGSHRVELSSQGGGFALESFRFFNREIPSYSEYVSAQPGSSQNNTGGVFRIEGENAAYKSDPSLGPTYDNTSCNVSPSDPVKLRYNTIGDESWKKTGQSVTWEIPREEIPCSGLYKIGIKARQDEMRGMYSVRRIYIDGTVPCQELDRVKFFYGRDWNIVTPKADGDDLYIYLDAASDHTLTMEAVPGETGSSLMRIDNAVDDLNSCYRQILMITGPAPDKYTDYYVHEKIPGLVDELSRISGELKSAQREIESLSGSSGSEAAIIERLTVVLDKCTEKPLKIPSYLAQIKESMTAVYAWTKEYRDQPLEIDYIEFASADESFSDCKKSLGRSAVFRFKSFIGSFFEDYTALSGVSDDEAVNVWISLGRDQAQAVRELTESRFMPEYGIPVAVSLVTSGVVEAALAGEAPDAALFLGGEFPVNLASRGLLTDLTRFDDLSAVTERFQKSALTQYTYNGRIYGIPISQSFPMMFYRTDILTQLGFDHPPETWDELRDMLPAIQRSYMSVGLVLPSAGVSPATETGHTFAMLMLQKGMNYYDSTLSASVLDSADAVDSFEEWTDFYTEYSFEQTYDAFSRFRTGEYPIVIQDYTFANKLEAASPEISGLWEFCPVPGTKQADGTVSHAANSNGSGAVIFNSAKNKEDAWRFIEWFTRADTQVQYASRIEGISGILGRFDTANLEALGQLSWSAQQLSRLRAQQEELAELPIIQASYAVTRNIMNAFRETVNQHENPRDTLIRYNKEINEEIGRRAAASSEKGG